MNPIELLLVGAATDIALHGLPNSWLPTERLARVYWAALALYGKGR